MRKNRWLNQIFDAMAVQNGDIVRRKTSDVHKHASHEELVAEVKSRGFHLVETGNQYLIICNPGALQLHC